MNGTLKVHQVHQVHLAHQAVHQAAHTVVMAVVVVPMVAQKMIEEVTLIQARILIHHHFLKKYASSVIYPNTEGAIFISFGIMKSTNGFK